MSYKEGILNGFAEALRSRFQLHETDVTVFNATKILNFKDWPHVDSHDFQGLLLDLSLCSEVFQLTVVSVYFFLFCSFFMKFTMFDSIIMYYFICYFLFTFQYFDFFLFIH